MQQRSFGSVEYEHKKVKTRRQTFLERMDRLVPWAELEQRIAPVYPKPGRGRRPYPLRVMLRIHCLQLWFNLSDPGMEQELYDSRSMLEFAGLSLSEPIPDETTILHFRHLLERHQLGTALFATINAHLAARGLQVREGTIVDSTIISAPSSTKNRERARDPEMHQTRKGRQWYFGMKLHSGTFQDRLVTELRLTSATTIAEAQAVLERFLPRFNARFAVAASQREPAWRPLDPALDLGAILAFRHTRTVARDNTVKYHWRTLQLLPSAQRPSYAGARVDVLERPGGELAVRHRGETIP